MKDFFKLYLFFFVLLLSGCGLSLPEISLPDFDSSKELEINDSDYNKVLNKKYDGYADDDDLDTEDIYNGAKKFAECSNSTECALLWDTAKKWITEKSKYKGKLKTNTKNLLVTKADPTKSKADKITFEVTRKSNGKTHVISIVADCPKNCSMYIHKEYFAFNSYLKNHLLAYKNDIVGYEKVEDEMFANIETSDNLDINFDDLSENNQRSVLEENNVLNKIEVTKSKSKRYIGKVAERLIDEYSCNKSSEINLVKKTRKRELYEVNCIKEVKRMIFDCGPDGCEVLQ
ncbi:MAG: hypothetical protein HN480_03280 [Gammaproteobacteria bacterium]|nr:hypothetical protein [Gammaproteobacteria bacterium]MBT7522920.1 hypothetical protein [Gammaproteobacteria bacterium]